MQHLRITVLLTVILVLILLGACQPSQYETSEFPVLLAEWNMGSIDDIAWSPDSSIFAVNYYIYGDEENSHLQAYDVESLSQLWAAENSQAMNLIFTSNGEMLVESHTFPSILSLRNVENGEVIRQLKSDGESCKGGGQLIIPGFEKNSFLVTDTKDLIGIYTNHFVSIMQWNDAYQCKKVVDYRGGFDIFDVNSTGKLLVYGGIIEDESIVVWNVEKQTELCHAPAVDYGQFVPGKDILAVFRDQKMIYIDALTCQDLKKIPITTIGTNLAFTTDGKIFAVANEEVQIVNSDTGEIQMKIPFLEGVRPYDTKLMSSGIEFSPDGRYFLMALSTGAYTGKIQLWQIHHQ